MWKGRGLNYRAAATGVPIRITVELNVRRNEARAVLEEYRRRGGPILGREVPRGPCANRGSRRVASAHESDAAALPGAGRGMETGGGASSREGRSRRSHQAPRRQEVPRGTSLTGRPRAPASDAHLCRAIRKGGVVEVARRRHLASAPQLALPLGPRDARLARAACGRSREVPCGTSPTEADLASPLPRFGPPRRPPGGRAL